jgi:hypothetical protein
VQRAQTLPAAARLLRQLLRVLLLLLLWPLLLLLLFQLSSGPLQRRPARKTHLA